MIRYVTFRKKPKDLLALTGLARREFDELLPTFEQALPKPPKRRQRPYRLGCAKGRSDSIQYSAIPHPRRSPRHAAAEADE